MSMSQWHTTAADNAAAGSINWAEGQLPSTVNNSARQLMSDVRTWYEGSEWIEFGETGISLVGSTTFEVDGDQTARYIPGRRVKITTNSSDCYGIIDKASFGAKTIVDFTPEDGEYLTVTISAVAVHSITERGQPLLYGRQEPLDIIYNGGMDIAQTGTAFSASAGITSAVVRTVDGWVVGVGTNASALYSISQDTASTPSIGATGVYIKNALKVTVVTAENVVASDDYALIGQFVEGYYARPILNRSFTVGFWVRSSETGNFSLAVRTQDAGCSYLGEYTLSTANAWTWKTVTVPAPPAGVVVGSTNTVGIQITWALNNDPKYDTPAGVWTSGNFVCTTAQPNVASAVGGTFYLTGVTLAPGGAAHRYYPPDFTKELERCERYYQKSYDLGDKAGTSAGTGAHAIVVDPVPGSTTKLSDNPRFRTRMRVAPTVSIYSLSGVASVFWDNVQSAAVSATVGFAGEAGFHVVPEASMNSLAHGLVYQWVADARMG